MSYVVHYCKNKKCNNAWTDLDITNAKTIPPQWKYCKECCKSLGIEFDSQTYKSKLSDKRKRELRNNLLNYRKQKQAKEKLDNYKRIMLKFKSFIYKRYKYI